jgi:hypothetical protein
MSTSQFTSGWDVRFNPVQVTAWLVLDAGAS